MKAVEADIQCLRIEKYVSSSIIEHHKVRKFVGFEYRTTELRELKS